jgi:hypothetical protein
MLAAPPSEQAGVWGSPAPMLREFRERTHAATLPELQAYKRNTSGAQAEHERYNRGIREHNSPAPALPLAECSMFLCLRQATYPRVSRPCNPVRARTFRSVLRRGCREEVESLRGSNFLSTFCLVPGDQPPILPPSSENERPALWMSYLIVPSVNRSWPSRARGRALRSVVRPVVRLS